MTELLALLDGREVGMVRQVRGRLHFMYADAWRSAPGAYPLSLSMPLAAAEHPHAAIEPFLWGLLPDNDFVVHQEDFCQALRVPPSRKYQNDGGPGPKQIIDVLRAHASGAQPSKGSSAPAAYDEDVSTFLNALILNWLIGGTDAHAKNYSILIGGGGLVRLAPLYDIASIFAYPDVDPEQAKLAMKIGGQYRIRDIGFSQWRTLATAVHVDGEMLVNRARAMADELPDRLADEVRTLGHAGLAHAVIDTFAKALTQRAARVIRL